MTPDPLQRAPDEDITEGSLGQALQKLREAKGISRSDVSARLKFSVKMIEALETENWSELPQGLPLRGMVKNYARLLDIDADAMLSMLASQTQQASQTVKAFDTSATRVMVTADESPRRSGGWGWLFIVLVLILIALFYALDSGWLPESWPLSDWFGSSSS